MDHNHITCTLCSSYIVGFCQQFKLMFSIIFSFDNVMISDYCMEYGYISNIMRWRSLCSSAISSLIPFFVDTKQTLFLWC